MTELGREFDRLVAAVHRRAVLWSLIEHTAAAAAWVGAAVAVGAGLGLVLPAVVRPFDAAAIGAVAGVFLLTVRTPSRAATLRRIDRQLRWAELATSADAARAIADAGMRETLLRLADAASRGTRPAAVSVARWTARRWGATILAIAAAGVVAGITPAMEQRPVERAGVATPAGLFDDATPTLPTPTSSGSPDSPAAAVASTGDEAIARQMQASPETTQSRPNQIAEGAAHRSKALIDGASAGQARAAQPIARAAPEEERLGVAGPTKAGGGVPIGGGGAATQSPGGSATGEGEVGAPLQPLSSMLPAELRLGKRRSGGNVNTAEPAVPSQYQDLVRAFHDAARDAAD